MDRCRAAVLDQQPIRRVGLRQVLAREPGVEVVLETDELGRVLERARQGELDVVVLAEPADDPGEPAVLEELARQVGVVYLAPERDPSPALAMLERGVTSCVSECCTGETLIEAVREALRGRRYIGPRLAPRLLGCALSGGKPAAADLHGLTPREREVFGLLVEGRPIKEVAGRLGISRKTVESHRRQLMEKLGVTNEVGLLRFAIQHKLTVVESP